MLTFKIIVLGDAAVGKTCLMNNYLGKAFIDHDPPTIGVEFGARTEEMTQIIKPELMKQYNDLLESKRYNPETEVRVHIWNSSGQERFHSIVTGYYRNTNGVVFVCDLTRKSTMNHLEFWIEDYKKMTGKKIKDIGCIIVGTKADLVNEREVYEEDMRKIAQKHNIPFFIVSNKDDHDKITRIFNNITNQMLEHWIEDPPTNEIELQHLLIENTSSKGCCVLL